jgi:4-hydroxybenzoate polyprenyltransferase
MRSRVAAIALSSHPGPTVAVTVIAVVLGIGVGLDPLRLILLGLAMLTNQLSVGLSNDWLDAERDRAVGRTDKPIARGDVSVGVVRTVAWSAAAASILLTVPLGPGALVANAVFIASAWSYNAWLKFTVFSVVPYVVSFGLLPAIVTLSREHPVFAAPWALGVGALLGVAAHFANVLPDLEDDAATGVRGLPHRMGRRTVSILTYLVLLAASVLEWAGAGGLAMTGRGGVGSPLGTAGLAATVVIAVIGITIASRPTRWHFRLIILAALIDVVVLAFAGDALLA